VGYKTRSSQITRGGGGGGGGGGALGNNRRDAVRPANERVVSENIYRQENAQDSMYQDRRMGVGGRETHGGG